MIFCTKVVQKVAKQMPVNLVQDDVKYQVKYVLCRDMHFGHITAGNYRRRFLSNSNWKNLQLKLAPGSKLVQKWVNKFRNLGTVDESKSPGEVNHQTTGHHRAGCRLRPAEPEKKSIIWRPAQAHQQNDFRRIMKEDCIYFIFT